jgi:hypothetical protein
VLGIEACRTVLLQQLQMSPVLTQQRDYSAGLDHRQLALLVDAMTSGGCLTGFTRKGTCPEKVGLTALLRDCSSAKQTTSAFANVAFGAVAFERG